MFTKRAAHEKSPNYRTLFVFPIATGWSAYYPMVYPNKVLYGKAKIRIAIVNDVMNIALAKAKKEHFGSLFLFRLAADIKRMLPNSAEQLSLAKPVFYVSYYPIKNSDDGITTVSTSPK